MSGNPFADDDDADANAAATVDNVATSANPFESDISDEHGAAASTSTSNRSNQHRQVSITSSAQQQSQANYHRPSAMPPSSTSATSTAKPTNIDTQAETGHGPRFALNQFNIQNQLTSDAFISDIAVGGGSLLVGVSGRTCSVHRYDQHGQGGAVEVINISMRSGDAIHRLFLDPTGNHTLISLTNGDNYYIHRTQNKAQGPINKLRSVVVDSVAWNPGMAMAASGMSGLALLGSSIGVIYEASLSATKGQTVTQVFRLRENLPICGLKLQALPGNEGGYFVMAVTGRRTRCYQFRGGPTFESLFARYSNNVDALSFIELPGALERSELTFFTKPGQTTASSFALLTAEGIFHGSLSWDSFNSTSSTNTQASAHASTRNPADRVLLDRKMLLFPERTPSGAKVRGTPLAMAETEYHFTLVYSSLVLVINKFTQQVVFESSLSSQLGTSPLRGLAHDGTPVGLWLCSAKNVANLRVKSEDITVWEQYLDRATGVLKATSGGSVNVNSDTDFEFALAACKSDEQRNTVHTTQAEFYYCNGSFNSAAKCFALTNRSFEEIALLFIRDGHRDALRTFLLHKLKALPSQERTKRVILASWLAEAYLDRLNTLERTQTNSTEPTRQSGTPEQQQDLQMEFWSFLKEFRHVLKPVEEMLFKLMASHGRENDLLFYAQMIEDYERIMEHHIQRGDVDAAVLLLDDQVSAWLLQAGEGRQGKHTTATLQPPSDKTFDLFYKYASSLMDHRPVAFVAVWERATFLDPSRLLPALIKYSQQKELEKRSAALRKKVLGGTSATNTLPFCEEDSANQDVAIRFLTHVVQVRGNTDEAVHNLLISLLASSEEDRKNDENNKSSVNTTSAAVTAQDKDSPLVAFVSRSPSHYDPKFALRVCGEHKHDRACVMIMAQMGLIADAVELALKVDLNLAKQLASNASDDDKTFGVGNGSINGSFNGSVDNCTKTKKELWLLIARHELLRTNDVKAGLEVVRDSQVLCIEDVLSDFPDFALIDDFKEEISRSLEAYYGNIESLKGEMDEYADNAELIREDIKSLRDRFCHVVGSQRCDLCGHGVLSRDAYVFPCTHAFHCDCLVDEVVRHVGQDKREQIRALQSAAGLGGARYHDGGGGLAVTGGMSASDAANKLDEFVAASCPFCGELMVQSIAEPFLTTEDMGEASDWDVTTTTMVG